MQYTKKLTELSEHTPELAELQRSASNAALLARRAERDYEQLRDKRNQNLTQAMIPLQEMARSIARKYGIHDRTSQIPGLEWAAPGTTFIAIYGEIIAERDGHRHPINPSFLSGSVRDTAKAIRQTLRDYIASKARQHPIPSKSLTDALEFFRSEPEQGDTARRMVNFLQTVLDHDTGEEYRRRATNIARRTIRA